MAAILGGGLGGLSTGYYLLKNNNNNLKMILLEATDYCGGWIKSIRTEDYTFEQGPRTIRPKGVTGLNTLNMIEDLGLSGHVSPIKHDHPAAKNRMIYANHQLHLLPSSLRGVFQTHQPFSKPLIYALFTDIKSPNKELKDDSIYNFVERRFGKEIADYAISPMICGICAGDAKEISVKFLMKTLFEWEQDHGGVVKGMVRSMFKFKDNKELKMSALARRAIADKWNVYTIKEGLDTFPKTLCDYLKKSNVEICLNSKVEQISFKNPSNVVLETTSGETYNAKHIYSSIPSFELAKLVWKEHSELAVKLSEIPFVTVGIVNLYFSSPKSLIDPAFGFLVPPIENSPILGVVYDSCCIPDQKGTVMTVMLGGKWYKEKFGDSTTKEHLLETALLEIKKILRISNEPEAYNVNILHNCIPQYVIGHYEKVGEIRKYIKDKNLPISLIGCSYDGVGINDVIYSAKTQVKDVKFTDFE